MSRRLSAFAIWSVLAAFLVLPLFLAAQNPLLAYRETIYIIAGFAGILGLGILLAQPLLAAGLLQGLNSPTARKIHRFLGALLAVLVILHVAALWITSPPDVVDALLLRSPTPFSIFGVVAMWAVFAAALLAVLRHRFRPNRWQRMHRTLVVLIVFGTVIHAVQIEGTMETTSKIILCVLVAIATVVALMARRNWSS